MEVILTYTDGEEEGYEEYVGYSYKVEKEDKETFSVKLGESVVSITKDSFTAENVRIKEGAKCNIPEETMDKTFIIVIFEENNKCRLIEEDGGNGNDYIVNREDLIW